MDLHTIEQLSKQKFMKGHEFHTINNVTFRINQQSLLEPKGRYDHKSSKAIENKSKEVVIEEKIEIRILIPNSSMGFVIGKQGSNLKTIRNQTKARLLIDKEIIDEKEIHTAVINGTVSQATKAEEMLNSSINSSLEKRIPFTHFISFPLVNPLLLENLKAVLDQMQTQNFTTIQPHYFINPNSFHLTLGMLSLTSEEEEKEAAKVLKRLKGETKGFLEPESISLEIEDIDCFPAGQQETARVVYAKIQAQKDSNNEKRFNDIIETIRFKFKEAGLMQEELRPLNLHATLLKVRNLPSSTFQSEPKAKNMDCRALFNQFKSTKFGISKIEKIQICPLGTFQSDGSYMTISELSL